MPPGSPEATTTCTSLGRPAGWETHGPKAHRITQHAFIQNFQSPPSHFTDEMPKAQRDSSSVMSIHSLDSVVSDPLADTLTPQLSAPHCTYNSITSHSKTLSCGSVVPGESPVGSEEVSSASVLGASTERPHSSARTKPRLSSVLIRNAPSGTTTTRVQQSPAGLPSCLQEEELHAFCPFLEHTPPHWHTTSGHPASWFFQC